ALFARSIGMPKHGGEQTVRVARINSEAGSLLAIAQAEMRPGFAGVGGFINAVADGEIGTRETFAAGNVNDVGIRRGNRDCPDRLRRLRIEDRPPGAAVII